MPLKSELSLHFDSFEQFKLLLKLISRRIKGSEGRKKGT